MKNVQKVSTFEVMNLQPVEYVPEIVVSIEQAHEKFQLLEDIKNQVLRRKIDYDIIPHTQKPTLLKPGAERLLLLSGLGHRIDCVDKVMDWEAGFFYFCYKATIIKTFPSYRVVIAECEGSSNSKENRFHDRWVYDNEVRQMGLNLNDLEKKQFISQKGKSYYKYKVVNPDPYNLVNTIKKMAIKRALVGVTIQATGTSGFFTQDVEDFIFHPPNKRKKAQPESTQQSNYTTTKDELSSKHLLKLKKQWNALGYQPQSLFRWIRKKFKQELPELSSDQLKEAYRQLKHQYEHQLLEERTSKTRAHFFGQVFKIGSCKGLNNEELKELCYCLKQVDSMKKLTKKQLDELIEVINKDENDYEILRGMISTEMLNSMDMENRKKRLKNIYSIQTGA